MDISKLRIIVVTVLVALIGGMAFGAESQITLQVETITTVVRSSVRSGYTILWRDLVGKDGLGDRLEVRIWSPRKGYSHPLIVIYDTNADGRWDAAYAVDSHSKQSGHLWDNQIVLFRIESQIIGTSVLEFHWERVLLLVLGDQYPRSEKGAQDGSA